MFFCCGRRQREPVVQKSRTTTEFKKTERIASAWQIPVPETKNIAVIKRPPTITTTEPDYELAHLQNNCELILFNTKEGSELFLSFAVKKTIMNVTRQSKCNYNSVDEQLYEILAKRAKDSDTLVIAEQADQVLEKKYKKYQQAYVVVMVIPQQHHFVSKLTTKSKISYTRSGSFDEDVPEKKKGGLVTASSIGGQNPGIRDKQKYPLDCMPFSHATQIKLNFFDQIFIYSPVGKDSSLSHATKLWLEGIVNNIHTLPNLQKVTMILPKEIHLVEIMEILQQLMQQKIKSYPLEVACNMIHFELECIYSELTFTKVIVKKRFEQGDLTIMLLSINLLLIQFNEKSKEFYGMILQPMKKITFKDYTSMKTQMKEGHNSKRALQKLLRDSRLLTQEQLRDFKTQFAEMTRLPDSWVTDWRYTFTVLRDLRVRLSEFLSCRVFIPACSYHVLTDNVPPETHDEDEEGNPKFTLEEELIVPSYKEELIKDQIRYSLLNQNVEIDIEVNEDVSNQEQMPASQKKSSIDDYELQSPRKITRRKNSNDY